MNVGDIVHRSVQWNKDSLESVKLPHTTCSISFASTFLIVSFFSDDQFDDNPNEWVILIDYVLTHTRVRIFFFSSLCLTYDTICDYVSSRLVSISATIMSRARLYLPFVVVVVIIIVDLVVVAVDVVVGVVAVVIAILRRRLAQFSCYTYVDFGIQMHTCMTWHALLFSLLM